MPETLLGRIGSAFSVLPRAGPVRLKFTDRRFVVASSEAPVPPPALKLYRAWRMTVPPGPVCQLARVPYDDRPDQIWWEIANPEVGFIRAHREVGIFVDHSVSDVSVSNMRQGWQLGAAAQSKPGVPAKSPDLLPMLVFRIPAPPEEVYEFLRQTPLTAALKPP